MSRNYSKGFASYAKKQNRLSEKFSRMYPKYREWKDSLFNTEIEILRTLTGRF